MLLLLCLRRRRLRGVVVGLGDLVSLRGSFDLVVLSFLLSFSFFLFFYFSSFGSIRFWDLSNVMLRAGGRVSCKVYFV